MTTIKDIHKYNDLIRTYSRTSKKLERDGNFPIIKVTFDIPYLSKEQYSSLIEWSGEGNASYFAGCINNFHRDWLVNNHLTGIALPDLNKSRNESLRKKETEFLKSISDLFDEQTIKVDTMKFFEEIKNSNHHSALKNTNHLLKFGEQTINHNIFAEREGYFNLILWRNSIGYIFK